MTCTITVAVTPCHLRENGGREWRSGGISALQFAGVVFNYVKLNKPQCGRLMLGITAFSANLPTASTCEPAPLLLATQFVYHLSCMPFLILDLLIFGGYLRGSLRVCPTFPPISRRLGCKKSVGKLSVRGEPFDKLRANGGCDCVQHFYAPPLTGLHCCRLAFLAPLARQMPAARREPRQWRTRMRRKK